MPSAARDTGSTAFTVRTGNPTTVSALIALHVCGGVAGFERGKAARLPVHASARAELKTQQLTQISAY